MEARVAAGEPAGAGEGGGLLHKSTAQTQPARHLSLSHTSIPSVAGMGAGLLATVLCSPLDVAKTRLQVQGAQHMHKYSGVIRTLSIIRAEEGFRGWYKGLSPGLLTVPAFWAIYFTCYERAKGAFKRATGEEHHVLSAMSAGAITDVITHPCWLVRTRMQTQAMHEELPAALRRLSMLGTFRHIYRTEGLAAFWNGLSASFLGLGHVAIQFPLYERLKAAARERRRRAGAADVSESPLELVAASAASKLASTWVTYPHEVLRARMQDARGGTARSLRAVATELVREEGARALWTGLTVNMVRVIPSCVATFVSYELITRELKKRIRSDAP